MTTPDEQAGELRRPRDEAHEEELRNRRGEITVHFTDDGVEEVQNQRRKGTSFSLLGNLIFLLTIAILLGISWVIYESWIPQDTADLPGFRQKENAPDIPHLLKQAINRDASLTLTEDDINRYFAAALRLRQHGAMAIFAANPAVGVRLHEAKDPVTGLPTDGYMELIIERYTGLESRQTISLYLTPTPLADQQFEQTIGTRFDYCSPQTLPGNIRIGGTIGNLTVPQGYIYFILPAYEELLQACMPLIQLFEDSGMGIQIRDGVLQLTPPQRIAEPTN